MEGEKPNASDGHRVTQAAETPAGREQRSGLHDEVQRSMDVRRPRPASRRSSQARPSAELQASSRAGGYAITSPPCELIHRLSRTVYATRRSNNRCK